MNSGVDGRGLAAGGLLHHLDFVVLGQVIDHHVEHEAVQLRLGQRIRAFHLDRILRGEHEERFGQRVAHAGGGDLMFLHGFEQRGLRLGRRAVDFVGQDHVGEDRAGHEGELPFAAGVLQNLRAGDVGGHEVGRELDALELEMKDLRDGFHEQRLGQAGRAGDQAMPAGKQRDEQLLDHVLLADDDLGQLGLDARAAGFDLFDGLFFGGVGGDGSLQFVPSMSSSLCDARLTPALFSEERENGAQRRVIRSLKIATAVSISSVRHGVEDDVDAERIGLLFRELAEVVFVVTFALPAVAVVGVVADDDHHAALVVEDGA